MLSGEAGTVGAENIAAELKVSPAHASLRMRLMGVFCRSIAAVNAFPHTLQCIFGCIYGVHFCIPLPFTFPLCLIGLVPCVIQLLHFNKLCCWQL
jgi:hypothetical protein